MDIVIAIAGGRTSGSMTARVIAGGMMAMTGTEGAGDN